MFLRHLVVGIISGAAVLIGRCTNGEGGRPLPQSFAPDSISLRESGELKELLDAKKRAVAGKLYDEKKHTIKEICAMIGISKPTLYKYIEASRTEAA